MRGKVAKLLREAASASFGGSVGVSRRQHKRSHYREYLGVPRPRRHSMIVGTERMLAAIEENKRIERRAAEERARKRTKPTASYDSTAGTVSLT